MYPSYHSPDSAARITAALDSFAFAGLAAFVFAIAAGLDSRTAGSLVLANWIILVPLAFFGLRFLAARRLRRLRAIHSWLLAFVAWAAASFLWSVAPDRTATRIGTYAGLVLFVLLIWELATNADRVRGLIVAYVSGAGAASLDTVYNYLTGVSTSAQGGHQWDTSRFSVYGVNADELGLILALSIPMALYLVITSRSRLVRAGAWLQVFVGFIAIFLSGTRGAIIALAVGLIAMIPATVSRMSRAQRGAALLACVVILCSMRFWVPRSSIDRFLSIDAELTQGTLTHRTVLWSAGLQVFRDHPFLGVGSGAYGPAIEEIVDLDIIGHNTFISVLVELGVIGALLLTALLASLVYGAFHLPYLEKCAWLAVLATWAIGVCSVTWENRKTTWFLFGLLVAQLYARRRAVLSIADLPPETGLPAEPALVLPGSGSSYGR